MDNLQLQKDIYSKVGSDLEWLKDRTIFITVHGSIAYNLNTPNSDIDLRSIIIPPKQYFYGFNRNFEQYIASDPYDIQAFSIVKFFYLASQCNPNIIELLFIDPEDYVYTSKLWEEILENREKFLSRVLKERYIGYAHAQLHRAKKS